MLRFYRVFGERIWLILWWMQHRGFSFNDIAGASTGERDGSRWMEHWQDANISAGGVMEQMREDLEDQLRSSGEHQDGALLSLVIETLNNPHYRNVLAGETLNQLRRGLLLPEEMASATERINRAEMACGRCGHSFCEWEVASYQRNTRSWLCTRCALPTHVACSRDRCLNGWVKIPARIAAWFQKDHRCPQHAENAAAPPAAPPVAEEPEVLRRNPRADPMDMYQALPGRVSGRTVVVSAPGTIGAINRSTTSAPWTASPGRITAVDEAAPVGTSNRIDALYRRMQAEQEAQMQARASRLEYHPYSGSTPVSEEDRDEP